jgi:DNA-binding transcriptional regulator YdaS (Cro superfamily)
MNLREHLRSKSLSYRSVADRLHVSVPLISHWCSGEVRIAAERAQALHREFSIPLEDLRPDLWPASTTNPAVKKTQKERATP